MDRRVATTPSLLAVPNQLGVAGQHLIACSNEQSFHSMSTRSENEAAYQGPTDVSYDALARLCRIASRRCRFRSRLRRTGIIEGIGVRVVAGVGSSTVGKGGDSVAMEGAGCASMISRTERPLSVMHQPPFSRSTRP